MDGCVLPPSANLLEANRQLYALRAQIAGERLLANSEQLIVNSEQLAVSGECSSITDNHSLNTDCYSQIAELPPHLGWESDRATAVIRSNQQRNQDTPSKTLDRLAEPTVSHQPPASNNSTDQPPTIKLYPDLALGMLRKKETAVGRIWLLLQHLDQKGQGWLSVDTVRQQLTGKDSPHHVCGWRQLRNLLKQGQDVFWQRDAERIWLRSTLRVAVALEVEHLNGRPVTLPISVLTAGLSNVRAHFYASFHSGRKAAEKPIARSTLAKISGVSPHSQRTYEKKSRVSVQRHIAIGSPINADQAETQAWQRGNALFKFEDRRGRQGKPGTTYLAWQLPNSYAGPHSHCPKGRQKRLNRKLADLFHKGMTGNDRELIEKRYFATGADAVKGNGQSTSYWLNNNSQQRRYQLWQTIN